MSTYTSGLHYAEGEKPDTHTPNMGTRCIAACIQKSRTQPHQARKQIGAGEQEEAWG